MASLGLLELSAISNSLGALSWTPPFLLLLLLQMSNSSSAVNVSITLFLGQLLILLFVAFLLQRRKSVSTFTQWDV